jgi:hypothetical protein
MIALKPTVGDETTADTRDIEVKRERSCMLKEGKNRTCSLGYSNDELVLYPNQKTMSFFL